MNKIIRCGNYNYDAQKLIELLYDERFAPFEIIDVKGWNVKIRNKNGQEFIHECSDLDTKTALLDALIDSKKLKQKENK